MNHDDSHKLQAVENTGEVDRTRPRKHLEDAACGENIKPVSISDVARLAGVSVGTVSRTLNSVGYIKKETRERVEKAARELNYVPNRAGRILKTNQTKLIMLAIPDTDNEIYFGMIKGVLNVIKQNGYSLLLYYTDAQEDEEFHAVKLLQERLIDGLILVHFHYSQALMTEIENAPGPIVLIGMCNHMWKGQRYHFDTVSIDVYKGIFDAVEHLIRMGHRKIVYLAGRNGIEVYQQRYRGYRDALEKYNIPYREDYVFWHDFTEAGGYASGREAYLMNDRATAICASNDLQAIGCWEAIKDLGGKIPGDIALTGMDNIKITRILNITSLDMHETEMGATAAELLMGHLVGKKQTYLDIFFAPVLQIHESSLYSKTMT